MYDQEAIAEQLFGKVTTAMIEARNETADETLDDIDEYAAVYPLESDEEEPDEWVFNPDNESCPKCGNENVVCVQCGENWRYCDCVDASSPVYCHTCSMRMDVDLDNDSYWDHAAVEEYDADGTVIKNSPFEDEEPEEVPREKDWTEKELIRFEQLEVPRKGARVWTTCETMTPQGENILPGVVYTYVSISPRSLRSDYDGEITCIVSESGNSAINQIEIPYEDMDFDTDDLDPFILEMWEAIAAEAEGAKDAEAEAEEAKAADIKTMNENAPRTVVFTAEERWCPHHKEHYCQDCNLERKDEKNPNALWTPIDPESPNTLGRLSIYKCVCGGKKFYCADCKVKRNKETMGWIPLDPVQLAKAIAHKKASPSKPAATPPAAAVTCKCPGSEKKAYFCVQCKVKRKVRGDATSPWVPDTTYSSGTTGSYSGYVGYTGGTGYVGKCRHYGEHITFPNGVKVYASSSKSDRKDDDFVPDFGLYCDWCWKPAWRAEFINWPDFGVPKNKEAAVDAIIDAYDKATIGWNIEVGCIGGHGRTGTTIACMGVLAGLKAKESIEYVRKNYCDETVEGAKQVWFVEWFEAYINNQPLPEEPVTVAKSYAKTAQQQTVCQPAEHVEQWLLGAVECPRYPGNCKWWDQDKEECENGKINASYVKQAEEKLGDKKPVNTVGQPSVVTVPFPSDFDTKKNTSYVGGYRIPPRVKGETHHNHTGSYCECDLCRYLARGHGAFLLPSSIAAEECHWGGSEEGAWDWCPCPTHRKGKNPPAEKTKSLAQLPPGTPDTKESQSGSKEKDRTTNTDERTIWVVTSQGIEECVFSGASNVVPPVSSGRLGDVYDTGVALWEYKGGKYGWCLNPNARKINAKGRVTTQVTPPEPTNEALAEFVNNIPTATEKPEPLPAFEGWAPRLGDYVAVNGELGLWEVKSVKAELDFPFQVVCSGRTKWCAANEIRVIAKTPPKAEFKIGQKVRVVATGTEGEVKDYRPNINWPYLLTAPGIHRWHAAKELELIEEDEEPF